MSGLQIPCPECGRLLAVPDRKLLGKKGRCPSCRKSFVLAEPEEVELTLADAPQDESPLPGTSARYVSEEQAGAAETAGQAELTGPVVGESGFPVFADPSLPSSATDGSGSSSRRGRRQRKRSRRDRSGDRSRRRGPSLPVIVGSLIVLLAVVGGIVAMTGGPSPDENPANPVAQPAAGKEAPREQPPEPQETGNAVVAAKKPIRLEMVPAGAHIIIHLHPAELWKAESLGTEVRYCLGPLGEWTEAHLARLCRFPPSEVETALICLMLGERGTPPEIAVVVHLLEQQKPSVLLEKFPGQRSDDYSYPVYLDEEHCYLRGSDGKTIAIGPRDRADEMASAVRQPSVTATGIEQLLPLTDRDRTVTVIFEPRDARNFQNVLVSETLRPFFNLVLDWFDDEEIETVAWSFDLNRAADRFESEILLRNHHSQRNIVTPGRLERSVQRRLGSLPVEVYEAVRKMKPQQVGPYRIISRFPAMVSAFVLETRTAVGDRHVQLLTRLPERAAPNLVLGTLLAWDESTRTDFSVAAGTPDPPTPAKRLPATVAGRLGLKIEVDFQRTPLQDAMNAIAEEIQVPIVIDGDALKLSGFTKNMPQTMSHTNVPAKTVIHAIIKKYKGMVIVVDEPNKQIKLMTQVVADQKKLKPFPVAP